MGAMLAHGVVGSKWTANIEESPEGKLVHITWNGVSAGDADQDVKFEFDSLCRENAEAVKCIAIVSTC